MSSILFVCLGNICRSPLAEAAFRREAEAAGLHIEIDSAGTGDWNLGKAPDPRAQGVARAHDLDISGHRARKVTRDDFYRFDRIVALDTQNLADLRGLAPADGQARLSLLLDHVPGREGEAVADPYYGAAADFDATWADVSMAAKALVAELAGSQVKKDAAH